MIIEFLLKNESGQVYFLTSRLNRLWAPLEQYTQRKAWDPVGFQETSDECRSESDRGMNKSLAQLLQRQPCLHFTRGREASKVKPGTGGSTGI